MNRLLRLATVACLLLADLAAPAASITVKKASDLTLVTSAGTKLIVLSDPAGLAEPTAISATDLLSGVLTNAGVATLTNKTINGASNTLTVRLASDVSGTLPLANGGTGQTSASAAINALVPSQTGNSGKVLQTNGSAVSWATASGGGSAISTPGVAYVQTSGNGGSDGTGTVGNPALPYATFQAAFTAGARTLRFGRGTFGNLSTTGAVEIWIGGEGEGATILGNITTTGALTVHDLGAWSFTGGSFVASGASLTVNNVSFNHADASGVAGAGGTADPETDGQVGGAGGTVILNGCRTAAASLAVGGSGGGGFAAADSEVVTNGGAGGNGGSVTIRGGVIAAYPQSYGGNGGEAGYLLGTSRNGGDGGNAGVVLLQNVTFPAASSLPAAPAGGLGGGGAGGGTTGADGTAGTILQLGVASDSAFYTDTNP